MVHKVRTVLLQMILLAGVVLEASLRQADCDVERLQPWFLAWKVLSDELMHFGGSAVVLASEFIVVYNFWEAPQEFFPQRPQGSVL